MEINAPNLVFNIVAVFFAAIGFMKVCGWFLRRTTMNPVWELHWYLKIPIKQAKIVHEMLVEEGIAFDEMHRHVENAMGHFLPMFTIPGSQLIATWSEVRRATVALILKGKYKREMSMDQFFDVVSGEISIQRGEMLPRSFKIKFTGLGARASTDAPEDQIKF